MILFLYCERDSLEVIFSKHTMVMRLQGGDMTPIFWTVPVILLFRNGSSKWFWNTHFPQKSFSNFTWGVDWGWRTQCGSRCRKSQQMLLQASPQNSLDLPSNEKVDSSQIFWGTPNIVCFVSEIRNCHVSFGLDFLCWTLFTFSMESANFCQLSPEYYFRWQRTGGERGKWGWRPWWRWWSQAWRGLPIFLDALPSLRPVLFGESILFFGLQFQMFIKCVYIMSNVK